MHVVLPGRRLVVEHAVMPAHDLLRAAAARFHEVEQSAIVVAHECPRCGSDAHGRPFLLASPALPVPAFVSLSRAGDLSVVAITDAGPVGVDVEPEGAAGFEGFDHVALHSSERTPVPTDPTRTWVRKEAVLKAYGLGLAVDPRDVVLDDDGLSAWHSPRPAPREVWLRDVVVPGHVAAVALLPLDDQDDGGRAGRGR